MGESYGVFLHPFVVHVDVLLMFLRRFILWSVLLFGGLLPLRAAHIIGGELSYVALGSNNYRVSLELYRDCNGGGALFDDPVSVFVYEATSGNLYTVLSIPLPSVQNVSPDLSDPCLVDPPILCVERTVYVVNINLPPLSGGYNLVYQRCCRNNTIQNLIDPGSTGSTYVAHIPNPGAMINSSPRFNSLPPLVICRDQPIMFDHSASDADGDSLVYELCRPFEGATPSCPMPNPLATGGCPTQPGPPPYGGISYTPPFSALFPLSGSLSIDPVTGFLTGTPDAEGQYVVGICAKEYRNGVLIANHVRDFQFNVTSCDRAVVAATSPSLINCTDYTITFDNTSSGATSFSWDFGVGGAGSSSEFPTFTFPDTGTYIVTLVAEPGIQCSDTTTVIVAIYPGADADFDFIPACPGEPSIFLDQSEFAFGNTTSWRWSFGDGSRTHLPAPARSYATGGTYTVTLVVTSSLGCVDSSTRLITIPHAPEIQLSAELACLDQPVLFSDSASVIGSSVSDWFWDFGDGVTATGNPVGHIYDSTGIFTVQLTVTALNGCSSDTSFDVQIRPPVVAEVFPGDTICQGEALQLEASGGLFYQWSTAAGLSNASIYNPYAAPAENTTYMVIVSDGCTSDTALVDVWVLPVPDALAWPDTTLLNGDGVTLQSSGGVSYLWSPVTGLSDPLSPNPEAYPQVSTTYTATVIGSNGCQSQASLFIEVLPRCKGFVLPNAFTPNADGINDVFRARVLGDDELISLEVYNRWGQQVFASNDPHLGWDGTYMGREQALGVYIYTLRAVCDGLSQILSGNITLLR